MAEPILDQLIHIISTKVDANLAGPVDPDAPLFEDGLGLDSIALMELIAHVEDQYGFQFAEEELNLHTFQNLRSVAGSVARKLTTQAA
jgi:acyl carrier protein